MNMKENKLNELKRLYTYLMKIRQMERARDVRREIWRLECNM